MNSKQYNVLVTGGAGFVGSHLVDALVERGHRVRVLDSLVPQVHEHGRPGYLNPRAEFIQADVSDSQALEHALAEIDVVFHQAAQVGIGQSMYEIARYVAANTMGTAVLWEKMVQRKDRIKKLVVASSMSIYGEGAYTCANCGPAYPQLRHSQQLVKRRWEIECTQCGGTLTAVGTKEEKPLYPTSVYAISKQDQEQLSLVLGRAYGIPTVALRFFNVYGSRQALSNPYTGVCAIFCSRLLNSQPALIYEDGRQTRDFVHVSDIVQANLLALATNRADYQAVNVGTGRATSVVQVAQLLSESLGRKTDAEIVGKYREGDIRHCFADISRAETLLGYSPRVKLSEGVPELVEWVRRQTATDRVAAATAELAARALVH